MLFHTHTDVVQAPTFSRLCGTSRSSRSASSFKIHLRKRARFEASCTACRSATRRTAGSPFRRSPAHGTSQTSKGVRSSRPQPGPAALGWWKLKARSSKVLPFLEYLERRARAGGRAEAGWCPRSRVRADPRRSRALSDSSITVSSRTSMLDTFS